MDALPVALIVTTVVLVIGRIGARYWIIRRYQAGRLTSRTAGVLIFVITVVPYVLLFLIMLLNDPGAWWLVLLLFIASWPLIVLPSIIAIHGSTTRSDQG